MYPPIPSLRGAPMHRLAVELYQRHHNTGAGRCATCGGVAPCPARRHAALVIATVGEDPRWYDGALPAAPGSGPAGAPDPSRYGGFSVTGRRPLDPAGYQYERDQPV